MSLQPSTIGTHQSPYSSSLKTPLQDYYEGIPPPDATPIGWSNLTATRGNTMYLRITNTTHFTWTTNKVEKQTSQSTYFLMLRDNGHLYFVAKVLKKLFVLDLDNGNYITVEAGA
jgi:hypothetical protein